MKKAKLETATKAVVNTTRDALQQIYDALNNGQRKKLLKDDGIRELLDRYGVEHE